MAAVFAGAGSVTAMAETADAATVETQAESQAAKPAPTVFSGPAPQFQNSLMHTVHIL